MSHPTRFEIHARGITKGEEPVRTKHPLFALSSLLLARCLIRGVVEGSSVARSRFPIDAPGEASATKHAADFRSPARTSFQRHCAAHRGRVFSVCAPALECAVEIEVRAAPRMAVVLRPHPGTLAVLRPARARE